VILIVPEDNRSLDSSNDYVMDRPGATIRDSKPDLIWGKS